MNKPLDSIICSLEIHKYIQKRTINEYKVLKILNSIARDLEKNNKNEEI